ncbi:MAG: magnesium and cobalt transport protein CorA [Bdellovibrio sp. CG12_big_fil_rev_8_21_14_0_65_39_13]|nr:MAG: magnesium and cobalt transport protein CorA [Bdellovibrio sp. CG22_combo_CG10-13_8_21_14_all_39_27]PIQ61110.1 MAG: magnesium and cobalt transport protein CorA [Bdellovibrio sp. CG12_big_fil_rev_8_21_14_0_65_39_13]PIR36878.1 MAG: magnesium and cobalt transport protein CorA [Bdellovibrio sp. CG11_big_fil_rev_8_21_14_0_20_39_38]PJB52379.1 MAG: magnesium and cobalt transport protein CorA [Bdellovibrio sp. CG_4_9_14_3_um_filter_39_7]
MSQEIQRKIDHDPGSLVYTGTHSDVPVEIRVISYSSMHIKEQFYSPETLQLMELPTNSVHWISVHGLHDASVVEKIGHHFGISVLTLEDILNVNQRPKFEEGDEYLYTVLKKIDFNRSEYEINYEQISLILKNNVVISFKENKSEIFLRFLERLKTGKAKARNENADFLYYRLLDQIIDHCFLGLSRLEDRMLLLEGTIDKQQTMEGVREIHDFRSELHDLQLEVFPLKDMIADLLKSDYFEDESLPYFKDLRDHISKINDEIKALGDHSASILDLMLSLNSFRMNEVMRTLTVFTAIFMPLTFITGIYGMNFQHMPILQYQYGFLIVLCLMILIGVGMFLLIKRKNWL